MFYIGGQKVAMYKFIPKCSTEVLKILYFQGDISVLTFLIILTTLVERGGNHLTLFRLQCTTCLHEQAWGSQWITIEIFCVFFCHFDINYVC